MEKILQIQVNIDEDGDIKTLVRGRGFGDDTSAALEIIGMLENLKQEQFKKLETIKRNSKYKY